MAMAVRRQPGDPGFFCFPPATAETVVLRTGAPTRVMSDVTIHGSPYKNANSDYDPDGKGVYLEKGTRFKGSNLTINADLTGIQLLGGNNSVSLQSSLLLPAGELAQRSGFTPSETARDQIGILEGSNRSRVKDLAASRARDLFEPGLNEDASCGHGAMGARSERRLARRSRCWARGRARWQIAADIGSEGSRRQ
ncbi:hypothetical protein ACVIHI_008540 [Bradyrhizobium sp. USDA 4524]|nr:hypothetical protein [Bradyrhizobium sp. USDA 4538]MCP1907367.1 hypothetical protein [Bradyrhizobium sp. USDA 4537]MCP1985153.1 hypothetical protein [Bradyrhizobium sp. USDA 4539]